MKDKESIKHKILFKTEHNINIRIKAYVQKQRRYRITNIINRYIFINEHPGTNDQDFDKSCRPIRSNDKLKRIILNTLKKSILHDIFI